MAIRTLAVCSWSLRPQDPAELVSRLGAAGLEAVQLDLTPMVDDPATWNGTVETLTRSGIRVVSGMMRPRGEDYSSIPSIRRTGGFRSDDLWSENQRLASTVADLAARHGVGLVTFHGGFMPHDATDPLQALMIERLQRVIDLFAGAGVQVALETGQESAACLQQVLQRLARATVGVNLDPANMLLYGAGDPLAAIRLLAPWIRQVHAKDAVGSGQPDVWGRETPVGAGAVPWPEFMGEVRRLPPDVCVVIEREGGERRVEEVAAARTFLQPML
jgi:sugar phosphate isomerase/epimerase